MPYSLPLAIDPEKDLAELAQALGLPGPPQRIEGFDISNISGTFKVASLVSFRNGRPDRANYRRFKIKTVEGQDDFASHGRGGAAAIHAGAEGVTRAQSRGAQSEEGKSEVKEGESIRRLTPTRSARPADTSGTRARHLPALCRT